MRQPAATPPRSIRGRRLTLLAAILGFFGVTATAALARPGDLDPSFGQGGVVVTTPPGNDDTSGGIRALVQDAQGRLVAVGGSEFQFFAASRFLPDGSFDPSFGQGGFASTDEAEPSQAVAVAMQTDGEVVAAGYNRFADTGRIVLVRYLPDGTLDTTFGRNGVVQDRLGFARWGAQAVAIEPDGEIVVAGFGSKRRPRSMGVVIRYRPDGSIDRTFGRSGMVRFDSAAKGHTEVTDLAILPSGKIVVAGVYRKRFLLARLRTDGSLDRSFGTGDGLVVRELGRHGICSCAFFASIAIQRNGRIVFVGDRKFGFPFYVVAAFRPNGRLDTRFGHRGVVRTKFGVDTTAADVVVEEKGRIIIVGRIGLRQPGRDTHVILVARYRRSGALDGGFDGDGVLVRKIGDESAAHTGLIQSDGRIVVAGGTETDGRPAYVLMRLLP